MKKLILWLLILGLLAAAAAIASAAWWGWKRPVPMRAPVVDYLIDAGGTPRQIAQAMRDAGIEIQPDAFVWLARLSGRDKLLKAGAYEAREGDTPWLLLERMANGDMTQTRLTFPEGWTFAQIRAALDADPQVRHDTRGMDDQALIQRLGLEADALGRSRSVLRDFGNMSSATLMFVLARMVTAGDAGRGVAMAFGPGLVAETFRFDLGDVGKGHG